MKNAESVAIWAMLPVLIGAGIFGWMIQLREPMTVNASRLAELPLEVGAWRGQDLDMEGGVEEMLAADFHVNRAYIHRLGDLVWLYLGYYGTERGGRPEHTPWACYPSNGWEIVAEDVVEVAPGIRANELIVEKDAERRMVHFWYQSQRRSGMLGGFDQALDRFISRLEAGRADGSLVRLSTPLADGDEWAARGRLGSFGREIAAKLDAHWPREQRHEDSSAPHSARAAQTHQAIAERQ